MPLDNVYRGVTDDTAIPHSEILRRYGNKRQDMPAWRDRSTLGWWFLAMGGACLLFRPTGVPVIHFHFNGLPFDWVPPVLFLVGLVAMGPFWLLSRPTAIRVPFNLPIQSGQVDPTHHDPKGRPLPAAGTVFAGNEVKGTNRHGPWVWFTQDQQCQHSAFCGTTGAGKSSAILGVIANALIQGSGVFLMDGKADLKFFQQFIALTRVFNRGYDLRFLNFLNIDPDIAESFNTNTMNMFSMAPADDMYNLLVSLKSEMGKENRTFSDRGDSLAQSVINMLCWARDNRGLTVSIEDIQDYITNLDNVFRLALGCLKDGKEFDGDPGFQMHARSVLSYIGNFMSMADIAAYAGQVLNINVRALKYVSPELKSVEPPELDGSAKAELTKQHGFAIMSFDKAFKTITAGYHRVFGDPWGDITIEDTVKNRRVVLVALPSLGKAHSEVMALAKVMISNIRGMASRALGNKVYGMTSDLLKIGVTKANSPYLLCFDEAGTYMQSGMDEINKQVRSLNFATILGFQDIPGLERQDPAVAKSALGSANYIYFMRIQDPKETGGLAISMASQSYAAIVSSFVTESAFLRKKRVIDDKNQRVDRIDRVSFIDLQSQPPGGAHLIAEGRVVNIQLFYVEPLSLIIPERSLSSVRRLAGWAPPEPSTIVLETGRNEQLPKQSVRDMPSQTSSPREIGSAMPATTRARIVARATHSENTSRSTGLPGQKTATVTGKVDPIAPDTLRQNFSFGRPVPPGPRDDRLFGDDEISEPFDSNPPPSRRPDAHDISSLLPTDGMATSADPYNVWVQQLEASTESRLREEARMPELVREFSSYEGAIEVYHEFLHLMNVGMPLALSDDASIDLPAMLCGLVSLCGVRAQNRRDSRTPPYVPMSWMPGGHKDGPISDRDAREALGQHAPFSTLPAVVDDLDMSDLPAWGNDPLNPDDTGAALSRALRPQHDDPFDDDLPPLVRQERFGDDEQDGEHSPA